MKLNLNKPLVIFDLETTGLDLVKDRVIQISYIKVYPDGKEERGDELINPEKHIEPIITQLTGISDETVKDKPTFKQLAQTLADKFAGSDFAGFNSNNFDIPLLAEEFLRAGIDFDFSKSKLIDACAIFRKMERRNLASAYKFYCGRKMEEDFEAHPGANEDPEKVLENDMQKLAEFSKMNKNVDFAGRIVWSEVKDAAGKPVLDEKGEPKMIEVFNFGKYKGMPVIDALKRDPGYYGWILQGDFTYNTKQVLTRIRLAEAKM